MSSVGRPPEVDSEGKVVLKCLVNVTIPTKLANFLKEKGINRSKLFTEVVKKMYYDELCPKCYGGNITHTKVGSYCDDCAGHSLTVTEHWLTFNKCKNCGNKYQPPYNMFAQRKDNQKEGCFDCIPKKERA